MTPQVPTTKPKTGGFFLKYQDFKKIENIIESYHVLENGEIDFNSMEPDEKDILWKVKTVIRNMESVRLRNTENKGE